MPADHSPPSRASAPARFAFGHIVGTQGLRLEAAAGAPHHQRHHHGDRPGPTSSTHHSSPGGRTHGFPSEAAPMISASAEPRLGPGSSSSSSSSFFGGGSGSGRCCASCRLLALFLLSWTLREPLPPTLTDPSRSIRAMASFLLSALPPALSPSHPSLSARLSSFSDRGVGRRRGTRKIHRSPSTCLPSCLVDQWEERRTSAACLWVARRRPPRMPAPSRLLSNESSRRFFASRLRTNGQSKTSTKGGERRDDALNLSSYRYLPCLHRAHALTHNSRVAHRRDSTGS